MNLFFIALKQNGLIEDGEREQIVSAIRAGVSIAKHLTHVKWRSVGRDCLAVCVSNEPDNPLIRDDEGGLVSICGFLPNRDKAGGLEPSPTLADEISEMHGRFSALSANPRSGEFAIAVPASRVDSVYTAQNSRFTFWGNQASVVGELRNGKNVYSIPSMIDFIGAGFYGSNETPFEGVTALPPHTTVLRRRGWLRRSILEQHSTPMHHFKRGFDMESCATFLSGAFADLCPGEPLTIGLTGGRDSRLVLAAALDAGIDVQTSTNSNGYNHADVWVAEQIARLVNVEHKTVDVTTKRASAIDLLRATKANLLASDGMLAFPYRVSPNHRYSPSYSVNGLGGETLRAGYGEKIKSPSWNDAKHLYRSLFGRTSHALRPEYREYIASRAEQWAQQFPESVTPGDAMDCLYVEARCGRWAAASSRGRSRRFMPLLDNRFAAAILAIPAREKRTGKVYKSLFEKLHPSFLDIPLATMHWRHHDGATRADMERRNPEAFVKPASAPTATDPFLDERRAYVLERLDLFSGVLDLDAARESLACSESKDVRLVQNVHAAAVMLTEKWR